MKLIVIKNLSCNPYYQYFKKKVGYDTGFYRSRTDNKKKIVFTLYNYNNNNNTIRDWNFFLLILILSRNFINSYYNGSPISLINHFSTNTIVITLQKKIIIIITITCVVCKNKEQKFAYILRIYYVIC